MSRLVNNFVNTTADLKQTAYSSPATGSGTRIDSFTATNTSGVNASYSAYIVTATDPEQPIIKDKIVVWGENDLGIGLVNQVIPPSSTLKVECSASNSVYFTVAGEVLD